MKLTLEPAKSFAEGDQVVVPYTGYHYVIIAQHPERQTTEVKNLSTGWQGEYGNTMRFYPFTQAHTRSTS